MNKEGANDAQMRQLYCTDALGYSAPVRWMQYQFDGFGSDPTPRKMSVRPIRRTSAYTCVRHPIKEQKYIHLVTPQIENHALGLTMRAIALSKWPTPRNVRTLGRPFRLLFGCFDRFFFVEYSICGDPSARINSDRRTQQ